MHTLTGIQIRDGYRRGEFTAVQMVEALLQRIEAHDGQIGAFLSVSRDKALEKARQLDTRRAKGEKLGRLAGVPMAFKDNIHIKGEITTCGSKFLSNYRAPFDSTVARLLEAEDAIFIGKTNLDEFGMGSSTENSGYKMTYNPWNLKCTPGGSSGGSAAAVAARFCPIAFGSDTGGSIRQPAGFCGIVGFKPTYGRVSRFGLVAYGSSLDQIGPLATSVSDIGMIMEIIGTHCEKDSTSLSEGSEEYLSRLSDKTANLKIGVPWRFLEGLAPELRKNFDQALEVYKGLGAQIIDVDLDILKYSIAAYYIIATAEASTNLARFDGIRYGQRSKEAQTLEEVYDFSRREGFGREVKRRIMLGTYVLSAGYQDAYYKQAQKVRTLLIRKFEEAFRNCDVIATPPAPSAAFEVGSKKDPLQMYLEDIYTIGVNLAGLPGLVVPSGFTSTGLPLGIQLIGPQKQDARVCQIGYAYESATHHNQKMPSL